MATATQSTSERIGERLRTERQQRGLSQTAVATKAQVGVRTLIRIEQGHDALLATIAAICGAMDLSVGEVTDA